MPIRELTQRPATRPVITVWAAACLLAMGCAGAKSDGASVADPAEPPADVDAAPRPPTPSPDAAAPPAPEPGPPPLVLKGGHVLGLGQALVVVREGIIEAIMPATFAPPIPLDAQVVDASGHWLVPGFIDSHVHLVYLPAADDLLRHGVVGAVDHAAPLSFFDGSFGDLRVLGSGPMITAPGGYPTVSWGKAGYGMECASAAEATSAVDRLAGLGAGLIKVPLTSGPQLDDLALAAVVARAHGHDLKVSIHALTADSARRAGAAKADVLAHTPTERLPKDVLETWRARAVITSLAAFGGGADAVANLSQLASLGATVLYGTDLGNSQVAAIQPDEIALMMAAGLDGGTILAAGTASPAAFWGFEDLGVIAPGKAASLLVLADDPRLNPMTLTEPAMVLVNGRFTAR